MKYLHETTLRLAFLKAGIVRKSNSSGLTELPGWWVHRAGLRKKRRG